MDAEIVLAWSLSTKANRKNIFVANQQKDIGLLKKERNSKLNMSLKFKYVPTDPKSCWSYYKGIDLE